MRSHTVMHSTSHLRRDNTNTTVQQDKIIVNSHATKDLNKDLTTNQRRQLIITPLHGGSSGRQTHAYRIKKILRQKERLH